MTLNQRGLGNEVGIRAAGRSALDRWLALMRTRWFVMLGTLLMKFGIHTAETDWGRYKETLVRNSDVRKFVDIYRQILAGTTAPPGNLGSITTPVIGPSPPNPSFVSVDVTTLLAPRVASLCSRSDVSGPASQAGPTQRSGRGSARALAGVW